MRTVKAGTLEKLVEHLVPAFQGSDLSYVTVFLCTYRAFTTTQQVLDLLFKRSVCSCRCPGASEHPCPPADRRGRVGGAIESPAGCPVLSVATQMPQEGLTH